MTEQGNPTLGPKISDIHILPLLFRFKKLFEIPGLLQLTIENTINSMRGTVIKNFASGDIYKMKSQMYKDDIVIPYILYFDDFQVNNPLEATPFQFVDVMFLFLPYHNDCNQN